MDETKEADGIRSLRIEDRYPEHEKMRQACETRHSQELGAFLEWLQGQAVLCAYGGGWSRDEETGENIYETPGFYPVYRSVQDWLALYFDIDTRKIEEEKQAMLEEVRERGN